MKLPSRDFELKKKGLLYKKDRGQTIAKYKNIMSLHQKLFGGYNNNFRRLIERDSEFFLLYMCMFSLEVELLEMICRVTCFRCRNERLLGFQECNIRVLVIKYPKIYTVNFIFF